jgi:hypothetical protein
MSHTFRTVVDGDVEVTLSYTAQEARRVASALRYYVSNVDAQQYDADRLILIATACELAANPKPAEPTGLGAVVEDAEGLRWVKVNNNGINYRQANGDRPGRYLPYADLNAVRVLSSGVEA